MNARALTERLDDEFEVFPFQAALAVIGVAIADVESQLLDELGDPMRSPGRRYYSVPQEQAQRAIEVLTGAAFVAGQAVINSTAKLLMNLRAEGAAFLPATRRELLQLENEPLPATAHRPMGCVPVIVGIDALANFFKHSDEWPDDWGNASGSAKSTIEIVKALGLRSGGTDNLLQGASALQLNGDKGPAKIGACLIDWRRRLTSLVRAGLNLDAY